jgi:hypothetical protein
MKPCIQPKKKTILAAKQRKLIAQHYTKKNIKKQEGFEEF